jgi:hypothetical protein
MDYRTRQESAASTQDRATGVVLSRRRDLPMHRRGAEAHSLQSGPLPEGHEPRREWKRARRAQRGGRSIWFVERRGRESRGMGSLVPDGGIDRSRPAIRLPQCSWPSGVRSEGAGGVAGAGEQAPRAHGDSPERLPGVLRPASSERPVASRIDRWLRTLDAADGLIQGWWHPARASAADRTHVAASIRAPTAFVFLQRQRNERDMGKVWPRLYEMSGPGRLKPTRRRSSFDRDRPSSMRDPLKI